METTTGTLKYDGVGISTGLGYLPEQLHISSAGNVALGIINPSQKLTITTKMKQVKAALFSVKRDEKTNEIIESEFKQEFWFLQKPNISFEVAAMSKLNFVIDPETEVVKEIYSVYL